MSRKCQALCTKNLENSAKHCYFLRFRNSRINKFANNVAKICSYRLKFLRNIDIKYLFHVKTYLMYLKNLHKLPKCLSLTFDESYV